MTGALWRHCTHVWEHGYRRWCLNVAPSRNQAKRENTFYINLAWELWTLFISIYSNIITKLDVLNACISVQLHLCKQLMIFSLIQEEKQQLALIVGWFWSFSSATTCSNDVGCTLTNLSLKDQILFQKSQLPASGSYQYILRKSSIPSQTFPAFLH